MVRVEKTTCDGSGHDGDVALRVAIVRSRFNDLVTRRLLDGALAALHENGLADERLFVIEVPGAIELALAARLAIEQLQVDAVVCLGAVVRGETDHYDHVCRVAADSIARVTLDTGVPVAFGVLTCDTLEQALARSGGADAASNERVHGGGESSNRGHDAALVALEMANLKRRLMTRALEET